MLSGSGKPVVDLPVFPVVNGAGAQQLVEIRDYYIRNGAQKAIVVKISLYPY